MKIKEGNAYTYKGYWSFDPITNRGIGLHEEILFIEKIKDKKAIVWNLTTQKQERRSIDILEKVLEPRKDI